MSVLDGLKPKNPARMKAIEDYLEKEIIDILSKKQFNTNYQSHINAKTGSLSDKLLNEFNKSAEDPLRSLRSRNNDLYSTKFSEMPPSYGSPKDLREEYLPFTQEEIKPMPPVERENNSYSTKGVIEEVLLDALMPVIEVWLEDNLERVVYKVVKKAALQKQEAISSVKRDIEEIQESYQRVNKPRRHEAEAYSSPRPRRRSH
ncbi:Protein of unknown function (DUF2497) [Candidatus Hepatincola sp. Av]